ncbi:MAG: Fe2+-dependent dioxygenase [Parvularculaceae bacterium]
MLLQIENVIDRAVVEAALEAAAAPGFWTDGRATAKGRARAVKSNEQALGGGPAKGVLEMLARSILDHETVQSAAQPAALARIMLNRYGEGMEYGAHVDAPYVDGVRTDLSFTLFLTDPADYDGGDLVIDSAGAEDFVKLPAGSLVLYPSTSLHRVTKVTRGARIACVGWIKSRVRSAEQRALLFDLDRIGADLAAVGAGNSAMGDIRDRLANVRNNLLRRWGE